MCGIAGIWSQRENSHDRVRLSIGLNAIKHRGPDDTGEYSFVDTSAGSGVNLGLCRLAVLDLSNAGNQPMSLEGSGLTISFNGEITNYVEIRLELESLGVRFKSQGDTEVLLRAWERWGASTLHKLEGMYAFAIHDPIEHTVTLVRDPFGIKPLYYSSTSGDFCFCSEIQGLLAMNKRQSKLDWQAAVDYLQWGLYDFSDASFVEGISQLEPGYFLKLDTRTGKILNHSRYWQPLIQSVFEGTYNQAVEEVRDLFLESVRRNLRSDVPVGVALSGGLDSTAIAGAIRYLEPDFPLDTFSFVAPGFSNSEHKWIEMAVAKLSANSHLVDVKPGELEADLDDLILSQGEPFGGTSIYAQYRVFKLAKETGVVVTLDGQGGDEVFAGYFGYPAQRLHSLLETGKFISAFSFAVSKRELPDWYRKVMPFEALAQFAPLQMRHRVRRPFLSPLLNNKRLKERGIRTSYPPLVLESEYGLRLKSHLRYSLSGSGLPTLLRHGDRNSMRFSIESRVPFLDRRLIQFLFSLPESWLVGDDGTTKQVLRDAVRDLVPEEIASRRDKIGFETPESLWQANLANAPIDENHPIGFLSNAKSNTIARGLTERQIRWGRKSHWRLINLHRWVSLFDIDAS